MQKLIKPPTNPVIEPKKENEWETRQTFNPGVIVLDNKVYFLYRAIGDDGISRFGYASSSDGFSVDERLSYPIYEHKIKNCSFNIFLIFLAVVGEEQKIRGLFALEKKTLYI